MTRLCIRKASRPSGLLPSQNLIRASLEFDTPIFQPIAFGVEKLEGYIVDATEDTVEGQELEVENEDGNVVAHFSGFGIKYNRTASVIPLSDASAPSPGDSFKIGEKFEFIVKSVKKSRARKDVEKWDLSGTYYPEVPMEPIS